MAGAGEGAVDVAWSAPADCPTALEVETSIRALLGRAPRLPDGRRLEVRARAERRPDRQWDGTIETRIGTTTGSRTIAAESCRAVADATALIVALMIDPEAVAAHASPAPAPAPVPPVRETPTAVETAVSRAPPPPPPGVPPRFSLGATVAADVGTLPRLVYAAGARVGVKRGPGALELGFLASTAASETIAGTSPPAGGSFRFLSASLAACPAFGMGRFDLGICAEIEAVEVKGSGFGVTSRFENSARWLALGGGAIARLRFTPHIAMPLRIDAVAPLGHPVFFLRGVPEAQGRVYTPSRVAARALLAVDFDF